MSHLQQAPQSGYLLQPQPNPVSSECAMPQAARLCQAWLPRLPVLLGDLCILFPHLETQP